ncbi:hypothetical protein DL93DRAFT_2089834 [Clavulina sp. PMI_390]|nr:hypothetical protein DL93DRAFT_2089834 [Clavulina sp. PMI_390]
MSTTSPASQDSETDASYEIGLSAGDYHPLFEEQDDTDIVLSSLEGILFRAHVVILRRTSSFFKMMFALPQVNSGLPSPSQPPIIPIDSEAPMLSLGLSMIYGMPFAFDMLDKPEEIDTFLAFCDKWEMHGPMRTVRCALQRPSLLENHPLWLYRTALRYDWPEVAKSAAMNCLAFDLRQPGTLLALAPLTITDFYPLVALSRQRIDVFRESINSPDLFGGSSEPHSCSTCGDVSNDLTWKVLRMRLTDTMEACPRGDLIRDEEMMGWPEWLACMSAFHCEGETLFGGEGTRSALLQVLDSLPTELDLSNRPLHDETH